MYKVVSTEEEMLVKDSTAVNLDMGTLLQPLDLKKSNCVNEYIQVSQNCVGKKN